jgi:hypothetical protein
MKKLLVILLLLTAGCAAWTRVGGVYTSDSQNYSVDLPQGWMRWAQGEHLLISRDGVLLQNIQVVRHNVKDPLNHTKKKLTKGMMVQETAEIILDNVASNPEITDFRVLENSPMIIGGVPGFRAVYAYKNKDGLKCKSVCCGLLLGEWLYGMTYNAAERYYFDRDIGTFNRIVESFKLIKTV